MIYELNSNKLALIIKFKIRIDELLYDVNKNYKLSQSIKTIDAAYTYLNKLLQFDYENKNMINIVENGALVFIMLDIISNEFNNIINENSDIYNNEIVLKKFTIDYLSLKRKCKKIDSAINDIIVDNLYEQNFKMQENGEIDEMLIIANFEKLSDLFKNYTYSFDIYKQILLRIIDNYKNIKYVVLNINEKTKNFILSIPNKNLVKNKLPIKKYSELIANNPYFKVFGVTPVSNVLALSEISKIIFYDINIDIGTGKSSISNFTEICKAKKYDIIIIQKYLNRGVNYAIIDLLDYTKSQNFSIMDNSDDGITVNTINRFRNIQYIAPIGKNIEFKINYKYLLKSDNQFTVILEEIYPGKFHVLSNIYKPYINYFVRKSTIQQFIEFISSKSAPHSRVENYNNIQNRGIIGNMFSLQKYDIKKFEQKSYLPDPTQLRYNIYIQIIKKFNQLKFHFKTLYDFIKLVHSEEFAMILTDNLTKQYNNIIKELSINKNLTGELYSSFICDLSIYERDFTKKMHDGLLAQVIEIINNNIFTKPQNIIDSELAEIFNKLVNTTLNSIIQIEKNIFQSLNYKLSLLKANAYT